MRTIPDISKQLQRVDEIIMMEFIPTITGGIIFSEVEHKLLSLPLKLGGLLTMNTKIQFKSQIISNKIIQQERQFEKTTRSRSGLKTHN